MALNKALDKVDYNHENYLSQLRQNISDKEPNFYQAMNQLCNDPKELKNVCKDIGNLSPELKQMEINELKRAYPNNQNINEFLDIFQQINNPEVLSIMSSVIEQNPGMLEDVFSEMRNSNDSFLQKLFTNFTPEMVRNYISASKNQNPINTNDNESINTEKIKRLLQNDQDKPIIDKDQDENSLNNITSSNSNQKLIPPIQQPVVTLPVQSAQIPINNMLPLTQSLLFGDQYGREILDDFRPENINNFVLLNAGQTPGQYFGLPNPSSTPINQGVRQIYNIKDFL